MEFPMANSVRGNSRTGSGRAGVFLGTQAIGRERMTRALALLSLPRSCFRPRASLTAWERHRKKFGRLAGGRFDSDRGIFLPAAGSQAAFIFAAAGKLPEGAAKFRA